VIGLLLALSDQGLGRVVPPPPRIRRNAPIVQQFPAPSEVGP
jgi:hypothetical protein